MKAVAFSNNDVAVVAWTFGGKLNGCWDLRSIELTCWPARRLVCLRWRHSKINRRRREFFWKDVYAKRGGTYKYKIVPLGGRPGSLQPMPFGPLISNQIQLTPHYGALSAYFNRGILATQATAKAIDSTPGAVRRPTG